MAGIDSNALLVLHCDGADGSTSFPDASQYNRTVTAIGSAQVDTAQSKFGSGSALFDAIVGDYLSVPDSNDWDFGTSDFTFDFQIRFNIGAGSHGLIEKSYSGAGFLIEYVFTDSTLRFWTGGSLVMFRTWAPSTATWYHVAIVRSGTNLMMFIDGTQIGTTATNSSSISGTSGVIAIGEDLTDLANDLNGWMDEIRISNIARWTSNFTAPTVPYSTDNLGSQYWLPAISQPYYNRAEMVSYS
jgi:hypothetical protein